MTVVAAGVVTVREVDWPAGTLTLTLGITMFCDAVVAAKSTVVTVDPLPVVPLTNPVPVTVDDLYPVTGRSATERAVTVGFIILIVELLMVIPLPQVNVQKIPGALIFGLLAE